jgi:hypothetical protein
MGPIFGLGFSGRAPVRAAWIRLLVRPINESAFPSVPGLRPSSKRMHGLSGLASDVAFEADGSVSLHFHPEFLAKNQVPGDPSPVLFLRPLTYILPQGDPDLSDCPVRASRVYSGEAKPRRGYGLRRLFLSLNLARKRDLSKPTLARWIVTLIRRAYKWEDMERRGGGARPLPLLGNRAHEVGAWAATLAAIHSTRLEGLLHAAYWRSTDVFFSFYLRDVTRRLDDGSFGVSSAVVAQQIMSSRH